MCRESRAARAAPGKAAAAWDRGCLRSSDTSCRDAIHIEQLQSCRLQSLHHNLCNALDKFVAEVVIGLAFAAQAHPIQGNGSRRLNNACAEMPAVRREEPRPAQHLARFDGLNGDSPALSSKHLQRNFALANDIKVRGRFVFVKDILPSFKADVRCASSNELHVARFKSFKEGMSCQDRFECLHQLNS